MTSTLAIVAFAFAAAGTAASAQDPAPAPAPKPATPSVSARLHGAWLREMLDLDVAGAVAEYETIAADRSGRPERWIAVGRLAELQRLGVPTTTPNPGAEAPSPVRNALDGMDPLPVDELLRRARNDDDPERDPDAERFRDLRPATWRIVDWVRGRSSLLSANDRVRQRRASRPAPEPNRSGPTRWEWEAAREVLVRELGGRAEAARDMRELHFSEWKPPGEAKGDPAVMLKRVRDNLDAWLHEAENSPQRPLLEKLRNEIEQRAATDAPAALTWIGTKLPIYAERLLREPVKTEPARPEPPKNEPPK